MDRKLFLTPEAQQAYARANIPMGYFGEPEDLAPLVAFLCSDLARYITERVTRDEAMCNTRATERRVLADGDRLWD